MKIVIVAGGTGGHIYPALELANNLKNDNEIIFFGNNKRMESEIIPESGYQFFGFDIDAISGGIIGKFNSILLMSDAYNICKQELKKIKPDVVIGFGNYVSVPVVLAAKKLKIKTIIHEQNSLVGSANKLLSHFVDKIIVSYPDSMKGLPSKKTVCLGNPRASLFANVRRSKKVLEGFELSNDKKTVLVFMGSLGSKTINDFMLNALKAFRDKDYQVLYLTGSKYYDYFIDNFNESENVKVAAYGDVGAILPNVTLLISRAGATTLAEVTALGVPSILIPSPYVPANHQYLNAMSLVNNKAAILIEERDLDESTFISKIDSTINDLELLKDLKTNSKAMGNVNACKDFINVINEVIK